MIPLCLVLHLASGGVYAQAQSDSPGDDHQTIQVLLLLERFDPNPYLDLA